MATLEQYFTEKLEENGLWANEAKAVIEKAKASEFFESLKGRWNSDIKDYPLPTLPAIWVSLKSVAASWLEENAPQHWALPMFQHQAAQQA